MSGSDHAIDAESITTPGWQRLPRPVQLLLPAVPANVFFSYRRNDDEANDAGLLAAGLQGRLGRGAVFFDKDTMGGGDDWEPTITRWASLSRRMVVVIGPNWLGSQPDGSARIRNERDVVRAEVTVGLRRRKRHRKYRMCVCLLPGATIPSSDQLPPDLQPLREIHSISVDPSNRLQRDVDEIIEVLRLQPWSRRLALLLAGALALLLLVLVASVANQWRLDEAAKRAARAPVVEFADGRYRLGADGTLVARQVNPFAIERHETTWAQYRECQRRGPCDATVIPGAEDEPVTELSAEQAATFCEWLDRRLPTVSEWEVAVRGAAGRAWPWGNDPPSQDQVNIDVGETAERFELAEVDDSAFRGGDSVEGIGHLVGNVAEWTGTNARCVDVYACSAEWDRADPEAALWVVGGSYLDIVEDPDDVFDGPDRPGLRISRQAVDGSIGVGFRCVVGR